MRRALAAAVAGVALGAGAAAPRALSQQAAAPETGGPIPAQIGFAAVTPQHLDVLLGDTVHWTNVSVRVHTVTADDGSFDSGRLAPSDAYSRTFTALGDEAYHCVIHPFIRGDVEVHRLLLTAPAQPAASNRPFPLAGRAALPAGSPVTIEADRGAGFAPVANATVAADGSFGVAIVPGTTATYRAVAGTDASPPVQLLVLDRTIAVRARRNGRRGLTVQAAITPASPGATVVLQLFLHEHLGWWPVQRTKVGRGSTARFALRLRHRVAVRVLLTLPDGATRLAVSRTIRLGPTR